MCLIVHRITAISALRNISTLDSSCISCSTRISTLDSSSCFSVTRQCSDCFVLCVWMCCIVFCCLWSSCYTLNTYCKYIVKKNKIYITIPTVCYIVGWKDEYDSMDDSITWIFFKCFSIELEMEVNEKKGTFHMRLLDCRLIW